MIKDSGERREFESGAVRDIQEGKGRCDLMPLEEIGNALAIGHENLGYDPFIQRLYMFQKSKSNVVRVHELLGAIEVFAISNDWDMPTALLEVAKHFEEGAAKYGEFNWQKGIPTHCYLDSTIRHYLKWLRGDTDEFHNRAVIWNLLCMIWTIRNKPEYDDLKNGT